MKWIDLESILLSEICQTKITNIVIFQLYEKFMKRNKSKNITKQKETHTYRGQTSVCQWKRNGRPLKRSMELRGKTYYV